MKEVTHRTSPTLPRTRIDNVSQQLAVQPELLAHEHRFGQAEHGDPELHAAKARVGVDHPSA